MVLQQEMGETTPKYLGEWPVARDRSWCVPLLLSATLAHFCINAYAEKADSTGPGVWSNPHLGLLRGESVAQPWRGSAGSWTSPSPAPDQGG